MERGGKHVVPGITVENNWTMHVDGGEKVLSFMQTLERAVNDSSVLDYLRSEEQLVNNVTAAFQSFNAESSKANAETLIKSVNALKAYGGEAFDSILQKISELPSAMNRASSMVSGDFKTLWSESSLRQMRDSVEFIKSAGLDVESVFSRISASTDNSVLLAQIEALKTALQEMSRRALEAEEMLKAIGKDGGLEALRAQIEVLKDRIKTLTSHAVVEFSQYLRGNGFDPSKFSNYIESIRNGTITAREAIATFRREYDHLFDDGAHTGSIGAEQFNEFSNKLEQILLQIENLANAINGVDANGNLRRVAENLSEDTRITETQSAAFKEMASSAEGVRSIVDILNELFRGAGEAHGEVQNLQDSITSLLTTLNEIAHVDSLNLTSISSALHSLNQLAHHSGSNRSLESLSNILKSLSGTGTDLTRLTALSAVRLDGFKDVKVSKTILHIGELSKTVNPDKLKGLESVNFENLKNIKIDKSAISHITELANAIKVLQEVRAASVNVSDSEISVSATTANSIKSETQYIREATAVLREYYALRKQAASAMASGDIAMGPEGKYVDVSGKYAELVRQLNEAQSKYNDVMRAATEEGHSSQANAAIIEKEISLRNELGRVSETTANKAAAAAERSEAADERTMTKQIDRAEELKRKYAELMTSTSWTGRTSGIRDMVMRDSAALDELISKYQSGEIAPEEFASRVDQLTSSLKSNKSALNSAGVQTKSYASSLVSSVKRLTQWFGLTRIIYAAYRAFKQMIKAVIELDSAFARLQIITGATDRELSKFADTAINLAKNVGQSVTDVTKAIETFSRLGYSLSESETLSNFATIMANVADVDLEAATTGITSIVKGFNMDVADAEHVADVLINVGQKYAVSASEMMDAYERSGAALNATNTSFEKSAALIAAANASVQNAQTVGTALKTVSARIRGSKTDLEELGEDIEDLADGFSKYSKEIKALTGFDIMVEGTTDQFKDIYDIFSGIAAVWDKLSDTQQARVAEILGGTRQLQVISSIIGNWEDAVNAYSDAMHSAGVATSANDRYMETAAAHVAQLKASFTELAYNLFNSDFIKFFVDLGKVLLNAINWLTKFKLLLFTVTASFISFNIVRGTFRVASVANRLALAKERVSIEALRGSVAKLTVTEQRALLIELERMKDAGVITEEQFGQIVSTTGLTGATRGLTTANHALAGSFKAVWASIPIWGWIALGVSLLIHVISMLTSATNDQEAAEAEEAARLEELHQKYDQIKSDIDETASAYRELRSSAADVIPRFVELAKGVNALGEKAGLTDKEYAEFLELNNRIAEMFPELNLGYDDNGNAMLALSFSADTLSDSLWGLVEAERAAANVQLAASMGDAVKTILETETELKKSAKSTDDLIQAWQDIRREFKNGTSGVSNEYDTGDVYYNKGDAYHILKSYLDTLGVKYQEEVVSWYGMNGNGDTTWRGKIVLDESIDDFDRMVDDYLAGLYRVAENKQDKVEAVWKQLNPIASAWLQTNYVYEDLPSQMQEIAAILVKNLDISKIPHDTSEQIQNYIQQNIINPIYDCGPDVRAAFASITEWKTALQKGEITPEEFTERVTGAFNRMLDSMDPDKVGAFKSGFVSAYNEMGIAGSDFGTVVKNLIYEWSKVNPVTRETTRAVVDLSDSVSKLKSNYDLLATAQKESASSGLTPSTIKSIKDSVAELAGEEANYLDYLYEENGVVKLNIQAYNDLATAQMRSDISQIQADTDKLIRMRDILFSAASSGSFVVAWLNAQIAENQEKLNLYSAIFDSIAGPYAEIFSLEDSVVSALTTVANLQAEVANGFVISLDKAREFAAVYPEILNGATLASDGQLQLNEDVVNAFIAGKEAEQKAAIDSQITELEAERATYQAKLEFAQTKLRIAVLASQMENDQLRDAALYRLRTMDAVLQAEIDRNATEVDAYRTALSINAGNVYDFATGTTSWAQATTNYIIGAVTAATNAIASGMGRARNSIATTALQAQGAAQAIAGIGSGRVQGISSVLQDNSPHLAPETVGGFTGPSNTFTGYEYNYNPQLTELESYISSLELDIADYLGAIDRIDGQIAYLRALREHGLSDYVTGNHGSGSGSGGGSGSGSSSGSNWFETQYKLHQHLRNMDMEKTEDYLEWLNWAYQQAYSEGIISLDDFFKYQEEVFKGLRDLFKDYLGDMEHQISMREHLEGENSAILAIYQELLEAVEREIQAAYEQGLDDNDDYVQELQDRWWKYHDAIEDLYNDIEENAHDAVEDLVQLRIDMLKDEIKREREALKKRLDLLKEFYDKQKEMLRSQYEEEKYLSQQQEKRKKINDILAELEQLRYDDSAWAQRRRLELQQQLAEAQADLDDFEHEHAIQSAEDYLDQLYQQQEDEINAEIELLDERENDAIALYQQALDDIRNGSVELYEEMIEWNSLYGDGIADTITNAWEAAYRALQDYKDLYGSLYEGIDLGNYTGYTPGGNWDSHPINGTPGSPSQPGNPSSDNDGNAPQLSVGSTIQVKPTATNYSPKSGGKHMPSFVPGGNYTVYRIDNDEVLIGRDGVYTGWIYRHDIVGYAHGTRHATPGLHRIDELGAETVFTSSDGARYRIFSGGEKVLNAKASSFLYDFALSGGEILGKIVKSAFGGHLEHIKPIDTHYEITMGNIIIHGNADEHTVSAIRRAQRESLNNILNEFSHLNR